MSEAASTTCEGMCRCMSPGPPRVAAPPHRYEEEARDREPAALDLGVVAMGWGRGHGAPRHGEQAARGQSVRSPNSLLHGRVRVYACVRAMIRGAHVGRVARRLMMRALSLKSHGMSKQSVQQDGCRHEVRRRAIHSASPMQLRPTQAIKQRAQRRVAHNLIWAGRGDASQKAPRLLSAAAPAPALAASTPQPPPLCPRATYLRGKVDWIAATSMACGLRSRLHYSVAREDMSNTCSFPATGTPRGSRATLWRAVLCWGE